MNKRRRRQYRKERRMAHGRWCWLALGGWLNFEQYPGGYRFSVPTQEQIRDREAYTAYLGGWLDEANSRTRSRSR